MSGYEMRCIYQLETPMRDGVILRGDLYRPAAEGAYPVLLMRTVFRKALMGRAFGQYDPSWYVRRGYAVFIQDVRGLGESDGEFDRFTADGPDGYDTIEWIAGQDWCSGSVGMFGSYYAGYLQIMAALENPPHLRAICPMQTSVSINRDCDTRGFTFSSHIGWCMSRQVNRLMDGRYDRETTEKYLPLLRGYLKDYPRSQLSHWPLTDMPVLRDTPFPLLQGYKRHLLEGFDDLDLLRKEGRGLDMTQVKTPAFYISGWYDSSRTPLIDHCLAQRGAGVDSRVLIAPWRMGEIPARPDSALEDGVTTVDIQEEIAAWFDHWLKGEPAPDTPAIRYYDITDHSLAQGGAWPGSVRQESWYLSSPGLLCPTAQEARGVQAYNHDPRRPLPYVGYGPCPAPQEDAEGRVLVFYSPPMDSPRVIQGLVRATVHLSSTARDCDVMLSLMDVGPDGRCFRICDGAARISCREGWESRPMAAGEVCEAQVLLGHVRYTLRRGRRLALECTGSAFPKYDVNHGTGCRVVEDAEGVSSVNTLRFSPERPSCLTLPLAE